MTHHSTAQPPLYNVPPMHKWIEAKHTADLPRSYVETFRNALARRFRAVRGR